MIDGKEKVTDEEQSLSVLHILKAKMKPKIEGEYSSLTFIFIWCTPLFM